MTDIDHTATTRVLKARGELILTRRFYGVLVSNVEPVLSRAHPTMATDGKRHFYNPDFIATLTQQELLAVQAHESEHDARHHGTRRNGRDHVKWNEACDYAINIDLKDQGFVLPKGALIDANYRGMSAEDIYRHRELDEQRQQQQQDEQDESEQDDSDESEASDDSEQEAGNDGEQDQNGDSDDKQEQGDESLEGEAQGSGGDSQDAEPQPHQVCGEVLDSATDASDLADQDIKWERVTREAAAMAQFAGQLPGHISREIERANNLPRDWRDELREFCEAGALRIETWNRPNRRFAWSRQILPGSQRDGINKAAVLIDTSGSMDEIALAAVRNELQALLDDSIIEDVTVVYGDVRVTRVDQFMAGDEVVFDPKGGGGTDLKPLFAYVAEELADASVLICFTDLDIGDPGPAPHCPVLFAVTGYPARVRAHLAHTPWCARGIDVGAH